MNSAKMTRQHLEIELNEKVYGEKEKPGEKSTSKESAYKENTNSKNTNNENSSKEKRKPYEELTFADDFMFCKVLSVNKDLCRELLELILMKRVSEFVDGESQKSVNITPDSKGVRFDVFFEGDDDIYDIEMQKVSKRELPKRMRYYQGMVDLNQLEQGGSYPSLKHSYIIFICMENPFRYASNGELLHKYTFRTTCMEQPDLVLDDEATKIILTVAGNADDVTDDMHDFLAYLETGKASSDFTRRLDDAVRTIRLHKKWRVDYMTYLDCLDDARMEAIEEGLEEGRKEGLKEGLKEGRKEGLEEGRKEGHREGMKEGLFAALIPLVRDGILDISDAAVRAGVTEKEFAQEMQKVENQEGVQIEI